MSSSTLKLFVLAAVVGAFGAHGIVAQEQKAQAPTAAGQKATQSDAMPRQGAQPVNIKVDLVIKEQREGVPATPKTITMMVADRERGQIRSGGGSGDQQLNVDVRPEIVRDSKIRVQVTFDYRAPRSDSDKGPPTITQSLSAIAADAQPLVISQWTEAGSNRTITVELRATIQK